MKHKTIFKIIIPVGLIVLTLLVGYQQVQAKELANVQFPIAELGGCESKDACKSYCDDPANIDKCLAFAEKSGLMSNTEVAKARTYAKFMKEKTAFPGGAKNPAAAKKYCEAPAHMDECISFAEKNGLIEKTELEQIKKFAPLMKAGQTPGGCKSKEECENYCQDEGKFDECANFAQKHGLASAEDIEKFKKIQKEGGPGGCKGKKECETFCNNPDNQKQCLEFAEKNGFIKPEEAKNMRENMGRVRAGSLQVPPEVETCMSAALGAETFAKMKNGEMMPGPEIGEKMKECFESFQGKMEQHRQEQVSNISPEVKACIREQVGEDDFMEKMSRGEAPDLQKADLARACFEKFTNKEDPRDRERREMERDQDQSGQPPVGGFGQGMPEAVKQCVLAKVGSTDQSDPDTLNAAARSCAEAARAERPKELDEQAEKETGKFRGLYDRFRGKPNEEERYQEQYKDNPEEYRRMKEEYLKNNPEQQQYQKEDGRVPNSEYQKPNAQEQRQPYRDQAEVNPKQYPQNQEQYRPQPDYQSYPNSGSTPSGENQQYQR